MARPPVDPDFEKMMAGYGAVTLEITYHMPDHPQWLQIFVIQMFDEPPSFPGVMKFLEFWKKNIDGELHSVRVAYKEMIGEAEMRHTHEILLN